MSDHFDNNHDDSQEAYEEGYHDGVKATEQDLLDQFAAAAIQGLLASESVPDESVLGASYISYSDESAAARAYSIAAAMLTERARRRNEQ